MRNTASGGISVYLAWPGEGRRKLNACLQCQRGKVAQHTKAPLGTFPLPEDRFASIPTRGPDRPAASVRGHPLCAALC